MTQGGEGEAGLARVAQWVEERILSVAGNCAHTRLTPVSPGAVSNTSSLFTYDSWLLIYQFPNPTKHDPNFRPLFPDETPPSQSEDVARLCESDHFCILDVISTGSPSVGNATRIAHQLHHHRLKSLQPGRGWEGAQGVDLSDHLASSFTGWQLRPVLCALLVSQWYPVAGYPHLRMGTRKA